MDKVIGNCSKHPGHNFVNCPLCEIAEQAAKSKLVPGFHAVQYANYFNIQPSPFYGDKSILDAEDIGVEQAEMYAELIAKLLTEHCYPANNEPNPDNQKSYSERLKDGEHPFQYLFDLLKEKDEEIKKYVGIAEALMEAGIKIDKLETEVSKYKALAEAGWVNISECGTPEHGDFVAFIYDGDLSRVTVEGWSDEHEKYCKLNNITHYYKIPYKL